MIGINNLTTVSVDEEFLKGVAKKVLEEEVAEASSHLPPHPAWWGSANKKEERLSIALVGQGEIKTLNKKYRKKNRITDTLSFKYNNSGEIVICPQEVKKNAKRFNSNFKKELARVLIHGILHLVGYEHEKSGTVAKKMAEKENYYLNLIFKC